MKKKLDKLFPWLQGRLNRDYVVGVAIDSQAVKAVCLAKQNSVWRLSKKHRIEMTSDQDLIAAVVECTNAVCNSISPVNFIIPPNYYQAVQMEKPNLTDEEIIQSLPWTAKDLVKIPPENIVADFLDYPLTAPMQASKINVYITDKSLLSPIINGFTKAIAVLRALSVEEMALVKLFGSRKEAHMLVIQYVKYEPKVLIVRDGRIVLTRHLSGFIGYTEKHTSTELAETVALELQRSMDFFEIQLKQPPISSIQMFCETISTLELRSELAEILRVKVVDFEPEEHIDEQLDSSYYTALGAALLKIETQRNRHESGD